MKNYDDTNDCKNNYANECDQLCIWGENMMMIIICYRSVVLFIPFGLIVLALVISCCSDARRLRMVSSGTTVTSVSEWLAH